MSMRVGRQLYVPALHLWYRPVRSLASATSWSVDIGMTDHGLTELGQISSMKRNKFRNEDVNVGDEVLSIHWDYNVIHTINEPSWNVVSGTYQLLSPVRGKVEYVLEADEIDTEDQVLLTISTDAESLQEAIHPLVTEEQYLQMMQRRSAELQPNR
jgi:hypothetical protein